MTVDPTSPASNVKKWWKISDEFDSLGLDEFFFDSSNQGDILTSFPKGYDPNPIQSDVLKQLDELTKTFDDIVINVPVGGGKSHIGYALANHFQPSFIVTTTLGLQNQYREQFPSIGDLRGQSHFECQALLNTKPKEFLTTLRNIDDYRRQKLTANYEQCVKYKSGALIQCDYKNPPADSKYYKQRCKYQVHLRAGLSNPITVINYPLFFFFSKLPVRGVNRKCVVFDEAHSFEDNMVDFVGVTITKKIMQDCGMSFIRYNLKEIDDVIELFGDLDKEYSYILHCLEKDSSYYPDLNVENVKNTGRKLFAGLTNLKEDPDNFVFYMDKDSLKIKPLDLSKYTARYRTASKCFYLSGTINHKHFSKMLGVDPDEIGFIDIAKSSFSVAARKIEFENIASMKSSLCTDQDLENVDKRINEILSKHHDQRGIIHTSSKKRCDRIARNLSEKNKKRVIVAHSINHDGTTLNEILAKHAATPGSVLISSSMSTGYDFKEDLARWQIIEKFPLALWGDPWIKAKCNLDPSWYYNKAIQKTLQTFGRIVRSEDDWGVSYCLDSEIQYNLQKYRNDIPKSFEDVLFQTSTEDQGGIREE